MDSRSRGILAIAAAGVVLSVGAGYWRYSHRALESQAVSPAVSAPAPPELTKENLTIQRGETLEELLRRAGMNDGVRLQLIAAVDEAFDVRRFRAGTQISLTRSDTGHVEALEYLIDPDQNLKLLREGEVFNAFVLDMPATVRVTPVCGVLEGSLFESMERLGERPDLTLRLAEIFGWQLDFYTDPQKGDEFCALVEKKEYENGQPATYQRILAARYINAGSRYEAYLFPDQGGKPAYYSRDGKSLQSAFLRSPMKFEARISSRFSMARRHPVLKIVRPHLGTDYAAPTGTPVQAVGSGVVVFAGRSGASGNMITLRHANGYETKYLHLSRILVRRGQRVDQGDRIGLVGATGLATGPHLDFRISQNGRFVNFERLRMPAAATLTAGQMARFAAERDRLGALMPGGPGAAPAVMASAPQRDLSGSTLASGQ